MGFRETHRDQTSVSPNVQPSVVAPGNYDGVHLGHRALLEAAREMAGGDLEVTVVTFDPHPAALLAPARAPALLTTPERRASILRRSGADAVEVVRFDTEFAAQSPEEFVQGTLIDELGARGVVVGPDFRFGKGRAGDVETLRDAAEQHSFALRVVDPVTHGGSVVSSTRIRSALSEGRVKEACILLSRAHDVGGMVVRGDQRGRTIGFPTANLECEPVLLPADGVYAVVVRVEGDDEVVHGVANLGVRPTVGAGRSVEIHLLDFAREIYGTKLRVAFIARLRGEERFSGLDALKAQIARDIERARDEFAEADRATWAFI